MPSPQSEDATAEAEAGNASHNELPANSSQLLSPTVSNWKVAFAEAIAVAVLFRDGSVFLSQSECREDLLRRLKDSVGESVKSQGQPIKFHLLYCESAKVGAETLTLFFASEGWMTVARIVSEELFPPELWYRREFQRIELEIRRADLPAERLTPRVVLLDAILIGTAIEDGGSTKKLSGDFQEKVILMVLEKLFLAVLFVMIGYYVTLRVESYKAIEARRAELAHKGFQALGEIWTAFLELKPKLEALDAGLHETTPRAADLAKEVNEARVAREHFRAVFANDEIWIPASTFAKIEKEIDGLANFTNPSPTESKRDGNLLKILENLKKDLLELPSSQ